MRTNSQRGEFWTWLLLLLALVPTVAVVAGTGWYWSQRGDAIEHFEQALVPANLTYELFDASSKLLRAEASLRVAALPGASEAVQQRAQGDLDDALATLRASDSELIPLVEQVGTDIPETDVSSILPLMVQSIGLGESALETQVVGEPVSAQLVFLADRVRSTSSGIVLPFADSQVLQANYLYDAVGTTVQYQSAFDRNRAQVLDAIDDEGRLASVSAAPASEVRESRWKDLISNRTFLPGLIEIEWSAYTPGEDPLLQQPPDPLTTLLSDPSSFSAGDPSDLLLSLQAIDDSLAADISLAITSMQIQTDNHITDLRSERELTAVVSAMTALLGLGLLVLTVSEVRRRRSVEVAHGDAMHQLSEKVDRDPTTGIWNRRRLERTLPAMIARAPLQQQMVVVAYLDLDHFKAINDVWGHATGDEVLRQLVHRVNGFAFEDASFELCRFGGDEFVLFAQTSFKRLAWLENLGAAIIDAIGSEMLIDGRRHEVCVSVGIATSNADSSIDTLLLEADSSLLLAKQERGVAVVYNRNVSRTGELVHALPTALTDGQIRAHIQPVIDIRTGEVSHVEALARWSRPNGEMVSPAVFIPLVESYGLAEKLTTNILNCARQITGTSSVPQGIRVWVNVSAGELDVAHFAERFLASLLTVGLSASRIGIEITETAAVRDPKRLAAELRRLRQLGVATAIDDFGSGYSPLGYLRDLPVDIVKLDRSLISHIDTDSGNQHLVMGVVGLLSELGVGIVAEGVERHEEEQWLFDHGVFMVQGFYFDKPVTPLSCTWEPRPTPRKSALLTQKVGGRPLL